MIGIVIAAHGRLAEELASTAAQIVGALPHVSTCSVAPGASAEDLRAHLCEAVNAVDDGEGVLVLADLYGGSLCTQSLVLCGDKRELEVLTGVNLPMLLKANSLRLAQHSLHTLARSLTEYAQQNITLASDLVRSP